MKYIILLIIFNFILGIIIPNEITSFIYDNFLEYINLTIYKNNLECLKYFLNDSNSFSKVFSFSGKYLGDFGNEDECLYNKDYYYYSILYFDLDIPKFVNTTQFKQLYFKNITNYFIGLCNLKICSNLTQLFDDENFKYFLGNESGIVNGKINTATSDDYKTSYSILFWLFSILFSIYIIFILTISFCYCECFKKEKKIYLIKNILKNEEYLRESDIEEENNENINNDKIKNLYTKKQYEKKLRNYYLLFNFNLIYNIKNLFHIINDVFIEKGLEQLTFIRFIMQYLVIYYFNIVTLKYFPPKDQFQKNFYNGFIFVMLNKNCSYALIGYIILDSALMSYKLMSYIRRHYVYQGNTELNFRIICQFSIYLIPKFFTYIFIYFFFYADILSNINFGTLFNFYHQNILKNAFDNVNWKELIFPYKDFISPLKNEQKVTLFLFVNIIVNEFLSYCIILILIYFSFKKKSNFFDKITLYSNLLLCILLPSLLFFVSDLENYSFNIRLLYGQNFCYKCLLFFFPFYYLGTIVGIGYFFEKDKNSNITLEFTLEDEEGSNIPTMINYKFIKLFYFKSEFAKKFFFYLIAISIIFFINIPFYIKSRQIFNNDDVDIDFTIENFKLKKNSNLDLYLYFSFVYEKTIYGFLFVALISSFLFYPNNDILNKIMLLRIFIPFQRLSHVFLCLAEVITFSCYCIFKFQYTLNLTNFILISFGIFTINIFVSLLIVILIEIPVRRFTQYFNRNIVDWDDYFKKEITNYDEN